MNCPNMGKKNECTLSMSINRYLQIIKYTAISFHQTFFLHQSGKSACCAPNTLLPPKLVSLLSLSHKHAAIVIFLSPKKQPSIPFNLGSKINLFYDYFFLVKIKTQKLSLTHVVKILMSICWFCFYMFYLCSVTIKFIKH